MTLGNLLAPLCSSKGRVFLPTVQRGRLRLGEKSQFGGKNMISLILFSEQLTTVLVQESLPALRDLISA